MIGGPSVGNSPRASGLSSYSPLEDYSGHDTLNAVRLPHRRGLPFGRVGFRIPIGGIPMLDQNTTPEDQCQELRRSLCDVARQLATALESRTFSEEHKTLVEGAITFAMSPVSPVSPGALKREVGPAVKDFDDECANLLMAGARLIEAAQAILDHEQDLRAEITHSHPPGFIHTARQALDGARQQLNEFRDRQSP